RARLEAQMQELQGHWAAVEERINFLTEALAAQTRRRMDAEQQAGEHANRQSQLEAELAGQRQVQAYLQKELEDTQILKKAHVASAAAQQAALEARKQELQTAQAEADQQVQRLNEAIAAENERREALKRRVAEHAKCLTELEAALAENQQTEKALQREM